MWVGCTLCDVQVQINSDLCRHSLVVIVFFSMSRQMGHISSLCKLRGDTAISVLSVITSWGVRCSSYKLNSHVLFDIGACSITTDNNSTQLLQQVNVNRTLPYIYFPHSQGGQSALALLSNSNPNVRHKSLTWPNVYLYDDGLRSRALNAHIVPDCVHNIAYIVIIW